MSHRIASLPLVLSCAAFFAVAGCADRAGDTGTESPDDVDAAEIEIEADEVGEDDARAVSPGPAELEIGMPQPVPNDKN